MKMSKSKILISLVIMVLAVLLIGNVIALATETTQITAATGNTTSNNTATNNTVTQIGATKISSNNAIANTNTNNAITTSNIVGAANTNTNNTNTNTNRNTNTSNYSTTNSSKLPYAGTSGTSIVILAIAFAASAIYAYKKVTDYNV